MKIGPLPDASRTPLPNALDPGFHCVGTHWTRGFHSEPPGPGAGTRRAHGSMSA